MSLFSELSNQESWGPLVSEGTVVSWTVPLTLKIRFSTMCKIHPQNTPSGQLTLATHTWSTWGRTREESLQAVCGSYSSSEEQVTAICVFSQKAPLPCFDANKPTDTLLIHRVTDAPWDVAGISAPVMCPGREVSVPKNCQPCGIHFFRSHWTFIVWYPQNLKKQMSSGDNLLEQEIANNYVYLLVCFPHLVTRPKKHN